MSRRMAGEVVYRDKRGVEYESVPLPTHEVTDAVPLEARHVKRRTERPPQPFYEGTDGRTLADQPRSHRKRWSDAQWGAYEEYRRVEIDRAGAELPVASRIVIKTRVSEPDE